MAEINLPSIGFNVWVQIAPTHPVYQLIVDNIGGAFLLDPMTLVEGSGGVMEPLHEEVTPASVAETLAELLGEHGSPYMWKVIGVRPVGTGWECAP